MLHTNQRRMLDAMLEDPNELVVESKSRHAALYTTPEGDAVLLEGDFSGPQEEQDAQIHRLLGRDKPQAGSAWRKRKKR